MNCLIPKCTFKAKGKKDLQRHMDVVHRRIIFTMLMMTGLLFMITGCQQFKRLTGDDKPAQVNGVWNGTIQLDGRAQRMNLVINQNGNGLGGTQSIDYTGTMRGQVGGTVGQEEIHLTIDEGTQCVNKFSASGNVDGGRMSLHIWGQGNNIPGTYCYPASIDQTVTLNR